VFQDLVEEPLIEYSPEMAASKAYQQISADLTPKAKDLQQEAIKQAEDGRTLTQVESDEIEDIWYDGSDAYDPEFCETLKDFYERQLEVVGSILYDPAEDDNFDSVPTNDESELIGAGDTGYEPDDDRDELSESKEGKCRECAPAHPWSKHLSGKGCQVPGCCCQAEPPQTESKKSFRQYLKEAEQGSKKKKS